MALTRDEIVTTAIALLDEGGLAALSLRKLAARLGISAPTLYWHVRDKRELLDLMSERIVADYRDRNPPPADIAGWEWHRRIAYFARMRYRALIEIRDAPQVMAGNRPTEAMLPIIERWLAVWIDAGFPHEEAFLSILALGNFILGSALEYQAETERARLRENLRKAPKLAGKDQFPHLKKAIAVRHGSDPHEAFETGLALVIDGLKGRLAEIRANEKAADERPPSQNRHPETAG